MAIVVVGGHTRNIGKTTLTEQILRATPELRWTAMKITQFGHGICSANGEACDCDTGTHTVAVSEERRLDTGTDTARMLAAGAARVLWVRTRQGQLADAMPRLRREIADSPHTLLESNSVLRFIQPDLSLAMLDDSVPDFKPTALRYLDRADVLVTPDGTRPDARRWAGISARLLATKPVYALGESLAPELLQLVLEKCRRQTRPAALPGELLISEDPV